MKNKKLTILDSTLRDGAQGEGISFSVRDKIAVCRTLDEWASIISRRATRVQP